jgi:hypothetical protein
VNSIYILGSESIHPIDIVIIIITIDLIFLSALNYQRITGKVDIYILEFESIHYINN